MSDKGLVKRPCAVGIFFLSIRFTGVQAPGPDWSQTRYNEVSCVKVILLDTRGDDVN